MLVLTDAQYMIIALLIPIQKQMADLETPYETFFNFESIVLNGSTSL